MNVVHISTWDAMGGAARAAYRLHKGLGKIGHTSLMVVNGKVSDDPSVVKVIPAKSGKHVFEEWKLAAIQSHYVQGSRDELSNSQFSLPYPGHDLSSVELIQDADIINLHWIQWGYQSLVTLNRLSSLGKPMVWTLHDQWAFTGGCHYSAGCEKYKEQCVGCPQLANDPFNLASAVLKDKTELFKDADLTVVAPSRWLARCARESALFKNTRVDVIPYSLETEVFHPEPKAEAKKRIGISEDAVTILFGVHRDEKRKGFWKLIEALQFAISTPGLRNLVCNDKVKLLYFGNLDHSLHAVGISTQGLGHISTDAGLRNAYSAADVFVLPSLEDNFPNTMLEAMSCGTPVVAFDAGGISELVADGMTGRLVPAGNIEKLGEAIIEVILNGDKREFMGKNCRRVIEKGYSLEIQARRYLELYRELTDRAAGSPSGSAFANRQEVPEEVSVEIETAVGPSFRSIYNDVLDTSLCQSCSLRRGASKMLLMMLQTSKVSRGLKWRLYPYDLFLLLREFMKSRFPKLLPRALR